MKDAKVESASAGHKQAGTWIALLSVLIAFAAFFNKSLFLGKSLARLADLTRIDALFNPTLKQAVVDLGRDPSGILIFFPNAHFEDSMWWRLVAPLWNPLVACGYPLLGDPQSLLYSPSHFLRMFSGSETYSLGLLLQMPIGAIGMVLLARYFSLSCAASALAALAYELSPRVLLHTDLCLNDFLFPWVFLAFAWLARKPSLVRASATGVLCAAVAGASHPETGFFVILFAAIFSLFSMALAEVDQQASLKERSGKAFREGVKAVGFLVVTAIVTICIASPLVVPFLEFMQNATIYKDANSSIATLSWQDFLAGVYADYAHEPAFFGAAAALLMPLGLLSKRRLLWPLVITVTIGLIVCLPQGPLLHLLSQKPLSYVATLYGVADIMLLLALLAGLGLDVVFEQTRCGSPEAQEPSGRGIAGLFKEPGTGIALALVFSAGLVVCAPILYLEHLAGTNHLGVIWKNSSSLIIATSILGGTACLLCLLTCLSIMKSSFKTAIAFVLVVLNFASLALVDRNIFPAHPGFSMNPPAPVAFLQKTEGRALSTGSNLFLPNTNLFYGVEDFRCFSPLLPSRYKKFLLASGGRPHNLYFFDLPDRCSRLLDLASVKYVMSRSAVQAEGVEGVAKKVALKESEVRRFIPGLRLLDSRFSFDQINSQVDAELNWRIHDVCAYHFALQYCVFDKNSREIWSSCESMLFPAEGPQHTSKKYQSFPVPRSAQFPVKIGLRIKDTWISQIVKPDKDVPHISDAFVLSTVSAPADESQDCSVPSREKASSEATESAAGEFRHYRLVAEFPKEGCRIYRNDCALPQAYLIDNVHHYRSSENELILKRISSESFDGKTELLVEDAKDDGSKPQATAETTSPLFQPVPITRHDCNTIVAECNANRDSWLVLTDSYYPGWHCYVDGQETRIYPANYLFRAAKIIKGHHLIKFSFWPASYAISLTVSITMLFAVLAFVVLKGRKNSQSAGRC